MGFWFLGGRREEPGLGWTGGKGGGVEPGDEVAEKWGPLVRRALSYMGVGPPEISR